jgi:hypothetical protein
MIGVMANWLGVVSADHVRRAVELGVAQINHGARGPLTRMRSGDVVVYYSSIERFGGRTPYRRFTAIGTVTDTEVWQGEDGEFRPWRRSVEYLSAEPVPLDDVRDVLHLTAEPNWGYRLRLGIVPLDDHDVDVLRTRMTRD